MCITCKACWPTCLLWSIGDVSSCDPSNGGSISFGLRPRRLEGCGGYIDIKMLPYRHRNSHNKVDMVSQPSNLYNLKKNNLCVETRPWLLCLWRFYISMLGAHRQQCCRAFFWCCLKPRSLSLQTYPLRDVELHWGTVGTAPGLVSIVFNSILFNASLCWLWKCCWQL